MNRIGESRLLELDNFQNYSTNMPIPQWDWRIDIYGKDGGFSKTFNIGSQNNPINSFSFTNTETGCNSGKIKFNKINFPIYYGDEIIIYYQNKKKYRGFASNIPDSKGDIINMLPYLQRLDEITINTTYTNASFIDMVYDLIINNSSYTGIYYNTALIGDYTDDTQYNVSYNFEKIKKIIEDYYQNTDDIYYGVEENGFFYLKKRSTTIDKIFYSGSNQYFQNITIKNDWSKIKQTRIHVFQKSTVNSGENIFISTIPDGSSNYPYISNETIVGVKEEKMTAPEGLNSTECKDWAYAKLSEQRPAQNIKIQGINIKNFNLNIGDRIQIYDKLVLQLKSIIDCETTTNWYGACSLSTNCIEGVYSINFGSTSFIYYDFGEIQRFINIQKLVFKIKSDKIGNFMQISFAETIEGWGSGYYSENYYGINNNSSVVLWNYANRKNFLIKQLNQFNLIEIPTTINFRYLGFTRLAGSTETANLFIDDIRLYGYFQQVYTGNVISLDYSINKNNQYLYDAEIGDYNPLSNDLIFSINKKVASIEATQNTIST
jgi:hypothetical protein